jgi:hypothetical protein
MMTIPTKKIYESPIGLKMILEVFTLWCEWNLTIFRFDLNTESQKLTKRSI